MKDKKILKGPENFEYNHLNYLSESVEIDYLMFEAPYKKAGYGFRKNNTLEQDCKSFKNLKKIAKFFKVRDCIISDNEITLNTISLVKILLITELYKLKLPNKRITEIYNNLEENHIFKNYKYFIDYYCVLAKKGIEINFYITDDATLLFSPEQYNVNKQMAPMISGNNTTVQTAIIISLNEILAKIYNDDNIRKIKNRLVPLSKKEMDILIEMNFNPGLKSINIDFDKENFEPIKLDIITENNLILNNLEELNNLKEEAKNIKYGKLGEIKVHNNKIVLTGDKTKTVILDKKK